jgi:hypothetical protein
VAENQEIVKQEPKPPQTIAVDDSSFSSYLDTAKFNQLYRVANVFAASDIVPEHYRNKPANCFLALQMATRLEIEPMMFIQNSYIVHGKPGLQAVVSIALVNSRGPFTGPIQWKFAGTIKDKTRQCTAYATHKVTGEVCEVTVSWAMVEAEGWNKKTGSKWLSIPDLMFQYRSASFLAKLYCPEVILGLPTAEELQDIEAGDDYKPTEKVSSLDEKLNRKKITSEVQNVETVSVKSVDEQGNTGPELIDQKAAELSEIDQFSKPVPPDAKNTQQDAQESKIPAEERYYCKECGEAFVKPAGLKKDMCPKLHKPIIDRWAKADKK